MPKLPTVMFLASGTPFWAPKDCENITAAAAAASTASSGSAVAVWSDKEKEMLALLGQGSNNNSSSAAGISGIGPLSSMSLRTLTDKSETLRSFGFLKTPPDTSSRTSLIDWYSGLAPMGQSVHAIEVC